MRIGCLALIYLLCNSQPPALAADPFSVDRKLANQLSGPMTSVVDGRGFRDALQRIAETAKINLWLDRRLDPTSPIEPGPVGPTVFAALTKLADARQAVVMPVANVVLVGRAQWVDQTAAAVLSLQPDQSAAADLQWDTLTTPAEAIAVAAGDRVQVTPSLPHDLWPAQSFRQIDRRVAITLILAQLDRRPQSTSNVTTLSTQPADSGGRFTLQYPAGEVATEVRAALRQHDRDAAVNVVDQTLQATATVAAHRAALAAWLSKPAKQPASGTEAVFSLQARATVGELLTQFAAAADRRCVIEESATRPSQAIIAIDATDKTLPQLVQLVAEQAGLTAQWTETEIVIRKAK